MQSLVSGVPNKVQTAVDIYQCTVYIAVSLHSLETAAAAEAEVEAETEAARQTCRININLRLQRLYLSVHPSVCPHATSPMTIERITRRTSSFHTNNNNSSDSGSNINTRFAFLLIKEIKQKKLSPPDN